MGLCVELWQGEGEVVREKVCVGLAVPPPPPARAGEGVAVWHSVEVEQGEVVGLPVELAEEQGLGEVLELALGVRLVERVREVVREEQGVED